VDDKMIDLVKISGYDDEDIPVEKFRASPNFIKVLQR